MGGASLASSEGSLNSERVHEYSQGPKQCCEVLVSQFISVLVFLTQFDSFWEFKNRLKNWSGDSWGSEESSNESGLQVLKGVKNQFNCFCGKSRWVRVVRYRQIVLVMILGQFQFLDVSSRHATLGSQKIRSVHFLSVMRQDAKIKQPDV